MEYQTIVFSTKNDTVLFVSNNHQSPVDAMDQLNQALLTKEIMADTPHYSAIRGLVDGKITEQDTFHSSEIR
jgi:hypothetical protein